MGYVYRLVVVLGILAGWSPGGKAQTDSTGIFTVISLDEFVVNASIDQLDVKDFIRHVREDSTFYQAFLNLRYFPHDITGAVVVYNKDDSESGTLARRARQYRNAEDEMWVEITREKSNGKIRRKNGEWRYLTAEIYDDIFFPPAPVKVSRDIEHMEQDLNGSGKEKHKAQLRRMMFNPGKEIENVPFIGDKMAIFDEKMLPHYNFNIYKYTYADSIPCIVFSAYTKEGHEDETVIRDMTSYFREDTFEIMARDYTLKYKNLLFDFDIHLRVDNFLQDGYLLPSLISYTGYWNIPLKKPEIIAFKLQCTNYDTGGE